jgi:hypothetical protein
MKLLSIDVGIKNLAYCLMEVQSADTTTFTNEKILAWDVINLCGQDPLCHCKKKAKYLQAPDKYFCQVHAKKSGLIIPTANISLKKIKKMKLADLQKVVVDYSIPLASVSSTSVSSTSVSSTSLKKDDLLKQITTFMTTNMLNSVAGIKANDMDLIMIGIAMRKAFDAELKLHLATIDTIVIENQISPIANRMKTLQGMIAQYFIMHDKTKIVFVSAANKLKGHTTTDEEGETTSVDTSNYAARKKEGVKVTLKLVNEKHPEWLTHFNTHKKKDDLADSFLQGVWYMTSCMTNTV